MPIINDILKQKKEFGRLAAALAAALALFFIFNWGLAAIFNAGLRQYYCLEPARVLIIGHSMSEMGIDRTRLEEILQVPVAKYCMNGAGTQDRLVMLKHYLETVKTPPEIVLYDVSARSFSEGLSTNSYALFFPFMDESDAVNDYIRKAAADPEYWQKKMIPLSRYDDTRLGAVLRGFRHDWRNRSGKQFDPEQFARNLELGKFWKITFDEDNIAQFDETLRYLTSQKIKVVLAGLPCVDMLNRAEPEKYARALAILQAKAAKYPGVSLLDLNPEFSGEYGLFGDPIHLTPKGQIAVTRRIGELIQNQVESAK